MKLHISLRKLLFWEGYARISNGSCSAILRLKYIFCTDYFIFGFFFPIFFNKL